KTARRAAKKTAKKAAAAEPKGDTANQPASGSPRLATTALPFQAPDPSLAKPERRRVTAEAGSPQEMRDKIETSDEESPEQELDLTADSVEGVTDGGANDGDAQPDEQDGSDSNDGDSNDGDSNDGDQGDGEGSTSSRRRR